MASDHVYRIDVHNFDRLLPEIICVIKSATFFGFDLEFTALRNDDALRGSFFDSMEDFYRKLTRGLRHVAVHQFGLAAFSMTPAYNYSVKCFNFYLCPRAYLPASHDPQIVFQSSSMLFNSSAGSNFEHSFKHGISYVDEATERKLDAMLSSDISDEEKSCIRGIIGFSLVFRELVASRKPFVGHNCFTDFLLMHCAFRGPMPEDYLQGKKRIRSMFPKIFDTKHLVYAAFEGLKSLKELAFVLDETSLDGLHKSLEKHAGANHYYPRIETIPSFEGPDASKAHEAGYDAYMAACVFLRLAHLYAHHRGVYGRRREILSFRECSHALRSHENTLNIIRGPVHSVSLRPGDNVADDVVKVPCTFLHVKPARESSDFGDLSAIIAGAAAADVRLHCFTENGAECALIAVRSPASAAAIYRLLNEERPRRYHVRYYSKWRHDPLRARLAVIAGAFLLVSAAAALWPSRTRSWFVSFVASCGNKT